MDIRGVVFDVDDTLYDMAQPFFGAYHAIYGAKHHLPMQKLFLSFRRYSDEKFVDSQMGKMTMDALYIYRIRMALRDYRVETTDAEAMEFQRFYMGLQYQIKLSSGMTSFLDKLRKHAEIGVITNGESKHQRRKIHSLDISPWVSEERIIVSGDYAFRKPDVRIFHEMERRLNLASEHLLYIGDAFDLDIAGAQGAGWKSIWFNHRRRNRPDGEQIYPYAEAHTEEELFTAVMLMIEK